MAIETTNELDKWFPDTPAPPSESIELGVIVGGSLSKGLDVKLADAVPIEDMAVGRYVVAEGQQRRFFCMITDVELDNTNDIIEKNPPDITDPFMADVLVGTQIFGKFHIAPMLVLEKDITRQEEGPRPVKTIPGHFTTVYQASEEDVNMVFGEEDAEHFYIGEPLDMEDTRVNLNLRRMTERSSGVFGKSGTGKSFLVRILLSGMIKKEAAVSLIFDMHNDYGWTVRDESGREVKGLRQLFGSQKVAICTLDKESSLRRGAGVDYEVTLGLDEITPEDIEMLRTTLDLSDQMIGTAYTLRKVWGKSWIQKLLEADSAETEELFEGGRINQASFAALSRRLERLARYDFLKPHAAEDSAQRILEFIQRGTNVVLEFGRFGNDLTAYILVANYLTRRLHRMYVKRMEQALGDASQEPPQLVIVIEEAHKFLDPQIARQTIFGTIAREMRKYNVTLLIVDQRPSAIDPEVMSQIGTRVTCLLDDENDIKAVLSGVSGAGALREVLARLDTKQQAIIMGHAVPMPVVVRTRDYDTEFYNALQLYKTANPQEQLENNINLIRGDDDDFVGFE